MPLILGTNSIKDTGYDVANSLRFDDASSDYLTRTPSSATSRTTWTWSAWVKRSDIAPTSGLFEAYDSSGNFTYIRFAPDYLRILNIIGGSLKAQFNTTALFRDVSAWYHIVWTWDTTNGTAGDRSRLYVNGTRITDFSTETNPTSGEESFINNNDAHYVGSTGAPSLYLNGYMAEVVFIDGQALDPTSFGEFDEDSPTIWKPKDVSGLTFGNNGFYLDFENSGSLGADASGNGNNFTVNNLTATDQSTDTCTNNFATMNPLNAYYDVCTTSEGNTKYDGNSATGNYTFTPANMGFSKGKWYWEMKFGSSDSDNWGGIGITSANSTGTQNYLGGSANAYAYYGRTLSGGLGVTYTNNTQTNQGLPFGNNDIIMVAVDCDNLAIYFGKNGTWLNNSSSVTGVPTSGSSKTGAFFSITAPSSTTAGFYFPASGTYSGAQVYPQFLNFGSPAFSISSGNSDGNGFGNFEYSVPSGYFALCTKNLAEHG
jgi:hypothetical protein